MRESLIQEYSRREGLRGAWGLHHENGKRCARIERSSQGPEKAWLFDRSIDNWSMSGNWNNVLEQMISVMRKR